MEDNRLKLIGDYQLTVSEIYKEQGIKSLAGPHMEFMVNGRQILAWFFTVARKGQNKYSNVDFHILFDDIISCSDEVMHFLALLFLYRPYMNNPIEDGHLFYDRMVYPNHQNLAAKRFYMYANTLNEKAYNYWDRIGDLIAVYFPEKLNPKSVFFGAVIDIIPAKFHSSENYKWLKEFKEHEYKTVNEQRKQIVHYVNIDTTFKHRHIKVFSDRNELEKLMEERDSLPAFFLNHIEVMLTGFEKTVQLIEEITEEEMKDIA
jgi:hypothetical protein